MTAIRLQLRLLFIGLMLSGVLWIQTMNYVRVGRSPLFYLTKAPDTQVVLYGGAIVLGLLLDLFAGLYLRPLLTALSRLRSGQSLTAAETVRAARLGIGFPERAAGLLAGVSVLLIAIHRLVAMSNLAITWANPAFRSSFISGMLRDLSVALGLALLLFVISRRILRSGVGQLGLHELLPGRRLTIGLRLLAVVAAQAVVFPLNALSLPPTAPRDRVLVLYALLFLVTVVVGYLTAADIGSDLSQIAARLRELSAGVRPALFRRQSVTSRDEAGEVVAAVNVLQERMEEEFAAMQRDLQAARSVQMGMLPRAWGPPPGWQVSARLLPAQEVGGDFYDIIDLGAGRIGLAVGDASGKGLPAALLMASTVNLLRSQAPLHERPGAVLEGVNRWLCSSVPEMSFVTAAYAVVDLNRLEVVVASAGHPPPIIGLKEADVVSSLPLGVDPAVRYEERVYALEPGAPFCLFSDGLVETPARDGVTLDPLRLAGRLGNPGRPAIEAMDEILSELVPADGYSPVDDITALLLVPPALLRLELPSQDGSEALAAAEAARFAARYGPPGRADDVASAVGEACLNALSHGNDRRADRMVVVQLTGDRRWLEATVADAGGLFVLPKQPPDLRRQMEGDEPIQGWGIHLMRSMADEVHLEELPVGKQIRLRFYGGGQPHV